MDVTEATFETDVVERSKEVPVVVDFWAAWCGPCRMLGPAIEAEVAKRDGRIELAKLDVEAEQTIAARYGIQSIPTVAVFRDGTPVTGFVGCGQAIMKLNTTARLKDIKLPVLAITGEKDGAAPGTKYIGENVPGAKYVSIPNAAHIANVEQAEAFNRALREFL